eukprot:TRINITY_DN12034_c0_g1_i3.p1 TRINITY_DN12034_c0_g1~~TRINITY_DN12034_c0_g1_i3.p1  ORF type:complete len:642 (+),score=85.19 TRINITY_DN12034_c0_g1_i3:122-2047(+)
MSQPSLGAGSRRSGKSGAVSVARPPSVTPAKQSGSAKPVPPVAAKRAPTGNVKGASPGPRASQSPGALPGPPLGNPRMAMVYACDGETTYRLRNLDLTTRTLEDLQGVVCAYTKRPAHLHSFYMNGDHIATRKVPLAVLGVRDGMTVGMRVRSALTILARPHVAAQEVEMRIHNIDVGAATFGELRARVGSRVRYPCAFVFQLNPASYVSGKADHVALGAAGVREGDVLMALPELAVGAHMKELLFDAPEQAEPKTPAQKITTPASVTPQQWRYPVPHGYLQIQVAAEGVLGGEKGPMPQAATGVTTLPLPPLSVETTMGELRRVLFDLLGVVPERQILKGLPPYGADESSRLTDVVQVSPAGRATLQLSLDPRVPADTWRPYLWSDGATARAPWCVHCIVAETRANPRNAEVTGAEWRPLFAQPDWTVDQLRSLVAVEAKADAAHCSVFYRGGDLTRAAAAGKTLEATGVQEGSCLLVLLRNTVDLTVHLQLADGRVFKTLLRGTPPTALPVELCYKALASHSVEASPSSFVVAADGRRLPPDAPLAAYGVSSGSVMTCVQRADPDAPPARCAPQRPAPLQLRAGTDSPPTAPGDPSPHGLQKGRELGKVFPAAPGTPRQTQSQGPKPLGIRWPPPPVQP